MAQETTDTTNSQAIPDTSTADTSDDIFVSYEDDADDTSIILDGGPSEPAGDPPVDQTREPLQVQEEPKKKAADLAREDFDNRFKRHKQKLEADDIAERDARIAELQKKLDDPFETIGGIEGFNRLARELAKPEDQRVKSPEQLKQEAIEKELADLKAFRDDAIKRETEAKAQAERAAKVEDVKTQLEAKADDYPFLTALYEPQFVLGYGEELIEAGVVDNMTDAFAHMEANAALSQSNVRTNKRALKAMFLDEANRSTLIEVLQELGITPSQKRPAQKAPSTLTNTMKSEQPPITAADGEMTDEEKKRALDAFRKQWRETAKLSEAGRGN